MNVLQHNLNGGIAVWSFVPSTWKREIVMALKKPRSIGDGMEAEQLNFVAHVSV